MAPDIAQPPLRSIGMDVKELPGWLPKQLIKALNIVCDTFPAVDDALR